MLLPEGGHDPGRRQGGATRVEELVVRRDRPPEGPLPHRDHRADRADVRLCRTAVVPRQRVGEGPPVHLPVRTQGQGVHHADKAGHHVAGQQGVQPLADSARRRPFGERPYSEAEFGPVRVPARHGVRLADTRQTARGLLDLAQFDTEPADLDLLVDPAEDLHPAVLGPPRPVPGPEHPRARLRSPRVREEAGAGEVRVVQIPGRDTRTGGVQFPRLAEVARRAVLPQHIAADVMDGSSVRHAPPLGIDMVDHVVVRPHAGLRRPAEGDQRRRRELTHEVRVGAQRHPVPAEEDAPQPVARGPRPEREEGQQSRERGGGGVPQGDAPLQQRIDYGVRFLQLRDGQQHQAATGGQDAEEVVHRQVEGEGDDLEQYVVGRHSMPLVEPLHEVHDAAVAYADQLGLTGRA